METENHRHVRPKTKIKIVNLKFTCRGIFGQI